MTQDTLERTSGQSKSPTRDDAVLERLQNFYTQRRDREFEQVRSKLQDLRERFNAERDRLFAPEVRSGIAESLKREGTDAEGRRPRSLALAVEKGVDLAALGALHRDFELKFRDAIRTPFSFHAHENVVGSVTDFFKIPPILFFPDPDKAKLYAPEYDGSWDRQQDGWATGDGAIDESFSYLDGGMARLGSRLKAHNHDASDRDMICAFRENGYLVPFRTLKTGILQVKADLSNLFCQHRIATQDEWGWSDFHATTRGRLVLAVFWKWEDVEPVNEVSHSTFVVGLDVTGDGESSPGTSVQAIPGERRIIDLYSTMAFPPGETVWIYVGLADRIWSYMNDVTIDISVDSAWRLNSLQVRSL